MVKMLFESYKSIMQMQEEMRELQTKVAQKSKAFNEVASLLTESERVEFTKMLIDYLIEQQEQ